MRGDDHMAMEYLVRNLGYNVTDDQRMYWVGVPMDVQSYSINKLRILMKKHDPSDPLTKQLFYMMWSDPIPTSHFVESQFEKSQ